MSPYEAPIALIDDALRQNISSIREDSRLPDDEKPPENAILSDWVMMSSWIDPDSGQHFYFRLNSKGCAPHAREGLLHMGLEMESSE